MIGLKESLVDFQDPDLLIQREGLKTDPGLADRSMLVLAQTGALVPSKKTAYVSLTNIGITLQ